jgi:RNA polymerase sigma-70 factor, ECF subfamily
MTDFSAMYRKYAPDVFRFALYLSGNRADAEDITSTTFIRAWTSPEEIRTATVKGYLLTIARNLFLKGQRSRSRHTALDESFPDQAPDPLEMAGHRDEMEDTMAAIQKLPEIDRAALLMRVHEDMPYDEIARALDITLSAARVKVHRARRTLMELREAREASHSPGGKK